MKSVAVFFVTFLMLLKPLWPLAEYISNYDYIVNVLCENRDKPQLNCNGRCYLAKQLAEDSEQNQQNPFSENQTTDIPQILDSNGDPDLNAESFFLVQKKTGSWHVVNICPHQFVFEISHPPELA
jgi:hypothetical protein